MKKSLILLFTFITGATWAQRLQVVVPNGLANVEGNSRASEPFTSTSFRFQQVFDASQFAIPTGASGRVDRIYFRLDGGSTEDVLMFFGGGAATLSTTPLEPDELSSVFAENPGADAVTIWNGALGIGDIFYPGITPQPWSETIPVTTPFYYIPSQGNLLLDVAASGGQAFLPGALDAQRMTGDAVSWVWSANGNSMSGTVDTFGLVTRFDLTIVPEPTSWFLGAAGLAGILFFRRR